MEINIDESGLRDDVIANIRTGLKGRPLVFIGLMGAGKSCIGRMVAKALDLDFVDADREIEEAAGCSIADIAAGMYAYSNILGAIIQRQKTGKGCELDISMLESLVAWMSFPMYYAHERQAGPQRAGRSHASIYPYRTLSTGARATVMRG